jgi:hypothetical protein
MEGFSVAGSASAFTGFCEKLGHCLPTGVRTLFLNWLTPFTTHAYRPFKPTSSFSPTCRDVKQGC